MRVNIQPTSVKLWLTADETETWANSPGESWPCSALEGKSLFAEFDENGLVDFAVDSPELHIQEAQEIYIESSEVNAITSDFLQDKLPRDHPCYFVAVGQFKS